MFWLFGHEACGILAPWPGIKPARPALEGEISTTGPPGTSRHTQILNKKVLEYLLPDCCSAFLPMNAVCMCMCVCLCVSVLVQYAPKDIFNHSVMIYLPLPGYHCCTCLWCLGHHRFILFSWEESRLPSASHLIFPAWVADPENDCHFHLGLWLSAVHGWVGWSFHQPASQTEMLAFVNFKSC